MKDSEKILAQGARLQYRISSNDKKPRSFGTDQLLHHAEIHFIDAIGPEDGLNGTQAAQKLGITNGAVTQIANKLVTKGLLTKYRKEENRKEVFLKLTDQGIVAFENHRAFHKILEDRMIAYLDSLDSDQRRVIANFMTIIETNLPDLNQEDKL